MRVLGIDHGQKRVGIALSDEDGRIAHPHETIARRDADALLESIAGIVREHGVEEIVVGLPLSLDGKEGASARRARRFAERLGEKTGLAVVLWDERMSTLAADRALSESGMKSSARRQVVDRVAAALVLQTFLDARHEKEDRWRGERERDESRER
jgi:putative Holliday junction resolvase